VPDQLAAGEVQESKANIAPYYKPFIFKALRNRVSWIKKESSADGDGEETESVWSRSTVNR